MEDKKSIVDFVKGEQYYYHTIANSLTPVKNGAIRKDTYYFKDSKDNLYLFYGGGLKLEMIWKYNRDRR